MIDLRSDTVTRPTAAMREAMRTAPVGDDVYGDDPTVNELEALAAKTVGMEAALFVCSGTMGNQLAIMSHTRMGEEIIAGASSHIIWHEAGAYARLAGVSAAVGESSFGGIGAEEVQRLTREDDLHNPRTSLVCLENALGDGRVVPLAQVDLALQAARERGLTTHLDGARLFNAATALKVPAARVAQGFDSVMFCLSKGLCAPVGSMLCGSHDFINKARRNRKVLGGGLRQAGVLAACGLLAIKEMTGRLQDDHDNARLLAQALAQHAHLKVDLQAVQINMVFFDVTAPGFSDATFVAYMKDNGVLINPAPNHHYRLVTHHDVSREDALRAASLVSRFVKA